MTRLGYTGGSLATGRVSQAGQANGEVPDEEQHPGPPGWRLSVRLTTPPCKNYPVQKSQEAKTGRNLPRRPGKKRDLNIGTWNIRTLFKSGALRNLVDVFDEYNIDILALQEIRWIGKGIFEKRKHRVFYSCQDKQHHFGTGFIVSKSIKNNVLEFKPINERICKLRLRGKHYNISLICAHAPTEDKDNNVKEIFYDVLENTLDSCPRSDMKLLIGDFNAKIGIDNAIPPNIGAQCPHQISNNNGEFLANFAVANELLVGGTIFHHRNIHKLTWRSPDGNTCNQIDHILIDLRHRSNLLDVRCFRGANVDSDHFLLMSKVRCRIKKSFFNNREQPNKKLAVNELKNPDILKSYKSKLRDKLQAEGSVLENDFEWGRLKQIIIDTAKETIPEENKNKKKDWYDSECVLATTKKNIAYKKMIQVLHTRRAEEEYKELRRQEKRLHKQKKKLALEEQFKEIETLKSQKESRKYYQLINNVRKEFNPRMLSCTDKNGELLNERKDILERWREHFKDLLHGKDTMDSDNGSALSPHANNQEPDLPSLFEVESAIKKLNRNRSSGPDGINAELLKVNEPVLTKAIHSVVCKAWTEEKMPIEWDEGSICPIFKKGDRQDCNNYRGITLLNIIFKVFSNVLYCRLRPHVENVIGWYQCGFLRGRSTTDQMHALRQILEKTKEFNIDTCYLFIDFKAAYDSINRQKLFEAMEEFEIPSKLIRLTKATLKSVKCKIKLGNDLSELFYTDRGLRQGDALSCLLFNLALEKVIRASGLTARGTIYQRTLQTLAFADDIALVGRSRGFVTEAFNLLETEARNLGLTINEDKTKFLEITYKSLNPLPLTVNNYTFEKVSQFKYLGTIITSDNDLTVEINNRLAMANRCYYSLKNLFKSRLIRLNTKINIYKTLLRPIILYGCECWALSKALENKLLIFERKILRKIFGAVCENGIWRSLFNFEIYRKYKQPNIVNVIKSHRIRWLGHLFRSEDTNPIKMLTFTKPMGSRKRGRPPIRWLDSVENDIKTIHRGDWRKVASDRTRWKKLTGTALACKRL